MAEGIIGQNGNVQVMEKCSSSSTKKGKRKKKAPKSGVVIKQKPKAGESKSKGKCFTCDQKGHWKDCPKIKARTQNNNPSGMHCSLVVEACFLVCTTGI